MYILMHPHLGLRFKLWPVIKPVIVGLRFIDKQENSPKSREIKRYDIIDVHKQSRNSVF